MAEVRIPTEHIPADILQRLQDIVGKASLTGHVPWNTGIANLTPSSSSSSSPSQLQPVMTCVTSSLMPVQPVAVNTCSNMALFVSSPSSSPYGKKSSDGLSWSLSSSSASSSTPSACLFAATAGHYTSAGSVASRTMMAVGGADDIDGGSCDSMTHLSRPSPRKRRMKDVLDDSGIVRVFPMEEDLKISDSEDHASTSQKDSEIVRIFPERNGTNTRIHESNIVRALTPVHMTPRPGSVHVFDNTREVPASCRKEWSFKPLHDSVGQSPKIPANQRSVFDACDSTPRRSVGTSCAFPARCEVANKHTNIHKSDPNLNKNMPCIQSPKGKPPSSETDQHVNIRHFTSCSGNPRRSPELPTPPQTPDDGDVEIGDDEVFTFTSVGGDSKHPTQTNEATRKCPDTTPRKPCVQLRHHSDRSGDIYKQLPNVSSSLETAQQMTELNFGDRQKTRKRLSFDEVMANQPPALGQHPYSCSSSHPQFIPQMSAAVNGNILSIAHASRNGHADLNKSTSPQPKYHHHIKPSSYPHSPSPLAEQDQPTAAISQKTSGLVNQLPGASQSPFHLATRRSPVQDVFQVLEKAVRQQTTSATPRRSRLHSDSEYVPQGQMLSTGHRRSPQPEVASPRRQTFSFGNRPHDNHTEDDENEAADTPTQVWPRDPTGCKERDCYCSKITRNFLQMVEQAYTGISQMNGTQAGVDRFWQELTQTNDILRESLSILQNIRAICQHNFRSLPGFSAT